MPRETLTNERCLTDQDQTKPGDVNKQDGSVKIESVSGSVSGSVSEVDREPLNGGQRDSNWRDRRDMRVGLGGMGPRLEDGAD